MTGFNDNGDLFPDWTPFGAVRRTLLACGLTEDETRLFEAPFEEFRTQRADSPLRLPENVRPSREWFRLLFLSTYTGTKEVSVEGVTYRENLTTQEGFLSQINLDNIGRDFVCLIYYQQRILDLMRENGFDSVLTEVLSKQQREPAEFTNLSNSLIPIEALTDYLTLSGFDMIRRDGDETIILSDPPQRRLTLREVPSFGQMLRDSANLSRYIRRLSVGIQDREDWGQLSRIPSEEFNLREGFSTLRDRRYTSERVDDFSQDIALSREFCLWDYKRGEKLPSLRTISEVSGIPLFYLIRVIKLRANNRDSRLNSFEGLRFLVEGFPPRLRNIFQADIIGRASTDECQKLITGIL